MAWMLLILAVQEEEPKIDYLLKPGAGAAVVRFTPSAKAPEIETDGTAGDWLAVDPKEGLGIVVVKVDTKEVRLKSGERRSTPAALATAKDVAWEPTLPEVEVTTTREGSARVRNRRRGAIVVFTASFRAAVIIAADGEADLPVQKEEEIVVVTPEGSGCKIPVPPVAPPSPFEWLPDRTFTLRGVNAMGHWRRWSGYDTEVRLTQSVGPNTLIVDAEEYDLNVWSGGLRADLGWFDVGFEYAEGNGDGTGRGEFQESGFPAFTGTSDFEVEIQAFTLFVERSFARFSGRGFRIDARGGLGLIFLREEISRAVIHTTLGDQQVDGSRIERERIGMARFSLEGRVEVTGSWSLIVDAGLEGHFGRGFVFGAGIGVGADF